MKHFFDNQEAFYNMVLSSTIMSNAHTKEIRKDAEQIIAFIGHAYKLSDEFVESGINAIFNNLSALNLTSEQRTVHNGRKDTDSFSDEDILLDIKSDVLSKLEQLSKNENINPNWFNYSYYQAYQPEIRFAKINMAGSSGNLTASRQVGILYALGIGCKKNLPAAIRRLTQCAYWGDIPSMRYLAYVYELSENYEKAKCFFETADIASEFLFSGCTVLPDDVKAKYSKEAAEQYIYISSILQDVINANNLYKIDFSFIEALMSDTLDYYKKMRFINDYGGKTWKDVTNTSNRQINIGFNK